MRPQEVQGRSGKQSYGSLGTLGRKAVVLRTAEDRDEEGCADRDAGSVVNSELFRRRRSEARLPAAA